jgi:ABC-type polysaccharide/polyol phosphate transport system ATPase subunit
LEVQAVSKRYTAALKPSMRHGLEDIRAEIRLRSGPVSRPLRENEFFAVHGVDVSVRRGGSLGVLGRNGAGKSTLLRMIAGITKPDEGEITVRGRIGSLLDTSGGFNPILTGRENVRASCQLWGVERRAFPEIEAEILAFAGLGEFTDAPLRTYSKGMRMRLGFAVAMGLTPDLLLVDEALAVGDVTFQKRCANRIRDFLDTGGALVLVSHSLLAVQAICREALVLEHGEVVASGDVSTAVRAYAEIISDHEALEQLHADARKDRLVADAQARTTEEADEEEAEPAGEDRSTNRVSSEIEPEVLDPFYGRPAVFSRVRVSNGSGGTPVHGGPLVVEATLVSKEPHPSLMWALLVYSADGTDCILLDLTDPDAQPLSVEAGETELRADTAALALLPGIYSLRLAIVEVPTGTPFALHGMDTVARVFEVGGTEDDPAGLRAMLGPPFLGAVVSDWSVE